MLATALIFMIFYDQTIRVSSSIMIGKVIDRIYVPSPPIINSPISFSYSISCQECLCYTMSSTISYVVLNCLTDTRLCLLYTSYSTNYSFEWNSTSYLYFFQLPPNLTTTMSSQTTAYHASTTTYQPLPTTYKTTTTAYQASTATYNASPTTYKVSTTTYRTSATTYKTSPTTYQASTTAYKALATTYNVAPTTVTVTASPPCTPQAKSSGTLFTITNPILAIFSNYNCYAYTWMATGSSATLSFFFRSDCGGWLLDDVNVYHGLTQMIINGGFESGNLTGWAYSSTCSATKKGQVSSVNNDQRSGAYYYYDCCINTVDTINQTFSTVAGDTYVISFWLAYQYCLFPTTIVNITIT